MKFTTIKTVLKHQIKNNNQVLWTWTNNHFNMIWKVYDPKLRIYTPIQLLEKIEKYEKTIKQNQKTQRTDK